MQGAGKKDFILGESYTTVVASFEPKKHRREKSEKLNVKLESAMSHQSQHSSYDSISTNVIKEGSSDSTKLEKGEEHQIGLGSVSLQHSSEDCDYYPRNERIRNEQRQNQRLYVRHESVRHKSMYMAALVLFSGVVFSMGFLAGSSSSDIFQSRTEFVQTPSMMQSEAIQQHQGSNDEGVMDNLMEDIHRFFSSLNGEDDSNPHSSSSSAQNEDFSLGFGGSRPERPLTYLNRQEAFELLMDDFTLSPSMVTISEYSTDFFLLDAGLDVQINQAYCAVATSAAIINSLRFLTTFHNNDHVNIPVANVYKPYPYTTQVDIFNQCTHENVIMHTGGGKGVDGILTPPFGLSMAQVTELLKCHLNVPSDTTWDESPKEDNFDKENPTRRRRTQATPPLAASVKSWSVQTIHADKSHITLGKVRFDIKNALADPNSHVLVNYDRDIVDQVGGGHWSPIGSYSEKADAFLVLDVAKYKYTAAWVPSERLFDAMATWDECGVWNFPFAQQLLSEEEKHANDPVLFSQVMKKLGCKRKLRGYIIVTRT